MFATLPLVTAYVALPLGEAARLAFAEDIGQQGRELLDAVFAPEAPQWLRQIPAVEILRQVWVQNYQRIDDLVGWRSSEDLPPASRYIGSPYDEEAHYEPRSEVPNGWATKSI